MKAKRNTSIDIIRGLCILSVILLHINIRIPFDKNIIGSMLPSFLLKVFFFSGYYGVIVFFVISGFLITSTTIKRWGSIHTIKLKDFYWLRFSRIMPCLIAVLLVLSLFDLLGYNGFVIDPHRTTLWRALFAALTFHINYLEAKVGYLPGGWDVLWSLSIEEVFYLFFPLLCYFIKRDTIFIVLLVGLIICGPFARTVFSNNDMWMDHSYLSCTDGLAFGCLAALLVSRYRLSKMQIRVLFGLGIFFVVFIVLFRKGAFLLGLPQTGLNVSLLEFGISLLLIVFHVRHNVNDRCRNGIVKVITWFGVNSYEIYLSHMFVVVAFFDMFKWFNSTMSLSFLWYIAIIIVVGLVGQMISRWFSIPMNRALRRQFVTFGSQ